MSWEMHFYSQLLPLLEKHERIIWPVCIAVWWLFGPKNTKYYYHPLTPVTWNWWGGLQVYRLSVKSLSSVQLLSRFWLFVTPWTAARQASLSITNSRSLLKLMTIELVMPSHASWRIKRNITCIANRFFTTEPKSFSSLNSYWFQIVLSSRMAIGYMWLSSTWSVASLNSHVQ